MNRSATCEAIFADICSGLRRSTDVPAETAIAIRDDRVGLWVTAPQPSPADCRRILGLAAVVANASLLVYFADARLALSDQPEYDEAFVCVGLRLDYPAGTEVRVRPYRIGRVGLRQGRTYGDEVVLGAESAVFGAAIEELSSSSGLHGDPSARAAAARTLFQRGFELEFDEWLDDEMAALL